MRKVLVAALASMLCVSMFSTNAQAVKPIPTPGVLQIDCWVTLWAYPSINKLQNATGCGGTATGVIAGEYVVGDELKTRVGVANNATFTASPIYHNEPCTLAVSVMGFGAGRATVTGIQELSLADDPPTATLTTAFNWTQLGAVAVITIGKAAVIDNKVPPIQSTITWSDGWTTNDSVGGAVVAVFDAVPSLGQLACVSMPLSLHIKSVALSA